MSEQRSATLSEVEVNEIRLLLDGLKPFDLEWAELRNLIGRMFAVLTVQEAAHARLTARVAEERAGMVVQDLRAQKAEAELTEARATIERLEKRVLELCDQSGIEGSFPMTPPVEGDERMKTCEVCREREAKGMAKGLWLCQECLQEVIVCVLRSEPSR
jgi:hypothetical protein